MLSKSYMNSILKYTKKKLRNLTKKYSRGRDFKCFQKKRVRGGFDCNVKVVPDLQVFIWPWARRRQDNWKRLV